jgi:hypothetical protein
LKRAFAFPLEEPLLLLEQVSFPAWHGRKVFLGAAENLNTQKQTDRQTDRQTHTHTQDSRIEIEDSENGALCLHTQRPQFKVEGLRP